MNKVKLGDICTVVSGSTPKSNVEEYWNGNIKWITPAEITSDSYIIDDTERHITDEAVKKTNLTLLPVGTVLLSSRAPIGKIAIAGAEMYCNQGFKNLICSERIYNKYLYFFLNSKVDYLNKLGRGATFKEISKGIVEEVEIPLPSLDEQKNIVKHFEAIQQLINNRKQALSVLDDLVKSRFIEMFGDLYHNPMNWPLRKFTDCATIESNMIHDFTGYEDFPHIGIDSIEKNTGALKGYRTVSEDGIISGKYLFTPKHIIYSKIRPNLNKVALPDFEGVCSADSYAILPHEAVCNRTFLAYVMRSPVFLDYILPFSNRTNLPKVNRKQVEGFKLPTPPIDLQNQFADFVALTDKSKFAVQQSIDTLQTLKAKLMQDYFG